MRGSIGRGAVQRVNGSRCVACNGCIVESYYCDGCALGSAYVRRDDPRSTSAKEMSRSLVRSQDRSTAHEHWIAMVGNVHRGDGEQDLTRPGREPARRSPVLFKLDDGGMWWICRIPRDEGQVRWRRATAKETERHISDLRISAQDRTVSYADRFRVRTAIERNSVPQFTRDELNRWESILNRVAPIPGQLAARRRALVRIRRERAERRRFQRFVELWPRLALVAFADAITINRPNRRRDLSDVISRIEEAEARAAARADATEYP